MMTATMYPEDESEGPYECEHGTLCETWKDCPECENEAAYDEWIDNQIDARKNGD